MNRPADLPEPADVLDPERPADLPDVLTGPAAADAILRCTYRVSVRESEARQLEQLAAEIAEHDVIPYNYLRAMKAAGVDLCNLAAFLDYWADQAGDGVDRHEIPVAATVLDVFPQLALLGQRLLSAVERAERQVRP